MFLFFVLLAIAVTPGPVPSPSPSATPAPASCAVPNREAMIVQDQTLGDYFDAVNAARFDDIELVLTVEKDGHVSNATVLHYQGGSLPDAQGLLQAARGLHAQPKIVNCVPVVSQYILKSTIDWRP